MSSKNFSKYLVISAFALMATIFIVLFETDFSNFVLNNREVTSQKLLNARNHLSFLLNQEKMKSGQLECNIKDKKQAGRGVLEEQVSVSGGYCQEEGSIAKRNNTKMRDTELAKHVSSFLKGSNVGAFGDGPGLYKEYYDKTGLLNLYDAYDGAPFVETETKGTTKFLDLSIPQYGLPIYDWVISLEVAEHIPQQYEEVFISSLVRHAKTGIILSWAVPGQTGHFHVNNKPLDLVVQLLKKYGFEREEKMSKSLQANARNKALKANTNIYLRSENFPIDVDDA